MSLTENQKLRCAAIGRDMKEKQTAEEEQSKLGKVVKRIGCDEPLGVITEVKVLSAEEHYWAIHEEIRELHKTKGADYGTDEDPFNNLRAAEGFGIPAWVGVALRMRDKMQRIQAFVKKGVLQNESIEDSLLDMANYAMLGLALYREKTQQENRESDE